MSTENNYPTTDLEAALALEAADAENTIEGAAILAALPENATFADLIDYIKADQKRIALVAASLASD